MRVEKGVFGLEVRRERVGEYIWYRRRRGDFVGVSRVVGVGEGMGGAFSRMGVW